MNEKILVLAPTGQVGFELCRSMATLGEIVTLSRADVDFIDLETLKTVINHIQPTIIANAAAYTAVDKAESEQENADILNHQLPKLLAQYADANDIWLIHYSSDYVYPGTGVEPWKEESSTAPLSVYGQSKLNGDKAIIANCDKYLIFRTSWVYAARGHNFMKTMLKLAQARQDLKVVNDQIGSPTPARLIANISAQALTQINVFNTLKNNDVNKLAGIYHLVPSGETSWYEFAKEIFAYARFQGVKLQLDDEQFLGIPTIEYPTPAIRPENSRMSIEKIQQVFNIRLPSWQSQLHLTIDELLSE